MNRIAKHAKKQRTVFAAATAVCTLMHFTPSAQAGVDTWTGGTNSDWMNADGFNTVPSSGDSLVFNAAGAAGAALNDDLTNSTFNIAGISFGTLASAYTISGNAFLLTGGITNSSTTAGQIINDAITLGGTETVTTAAGGITLNGVIDSGANAYGLTKAGTGTLTLTNTELYSGNTTVTAGNLTLAGYQASAASSAFTVSTGGTLAINSGSGTAAASVTRGSSLAINNGAVTLTGAGANTVDAFTGALSVGAGPSTLTLTPNAAGNAQLSFGSLATHTTGSFLTLAGTFGATPGVNVANLFFTTTPSGANFVGGGGANVATGTSTASVIPWMRINDNSSTLYTYDSVKGVQALTGGSNNLTSGATSNATLTTTNGTYTLAADTTVNSVRVSAATGSNIAMAGHTLTVTSGAISANIFTTVGSDTATPGTLAFGSAEGVISVVQARSITINSVISGSGGLTFTGYRNGSGTPGLLILNGANTYTGVTNLYGVETTGTAEFRLNNSLALQNSTLNYVAGYGASLTLGNGTAGKTAYTFGGLMGTANITLANNNTTAQTVALTLGNDGLNDTYSGNLLNGGGAAAGGSLIFNGTGSQTLLGAGSTYAGGTSVQNGTLILGHGGVLSASNTLTLGSGANSGTFQLGDPTAAVNTTVTNLQTSGSGTTNAVVGGNSGVSTLTVNIASGSQTFAGTLGGAGTNQNNLGLTKTGGGIFVLSGTSTHTGPTAVSAGTLTVSGSLNGLSAVNVSGGATLNGYGTIAGGVTLAGGTTTATQGNINLQDAMTSTFTLGGLTVGGGTAGQVSNLSFDLGNGTLTNDAINLGSNVFTGNAGGAVINVDQLGALAQGTYTLMTFGSASGLTVGTNLTLNAPAHFGTTYELDLNSGSLTLMVSGVDAPHAAYWSGVQGGSYNWGDHGTTTTNWNTDQTGSTDTGAAPGATSDVVFANSNATGASLTTLLEAAYSINSLTILGTGQTTATTGTATTIGGTGALNLIAAASQSGSLGYAAGTGIVIGAGSAGLTISTSGGVGVNANQSWTNNSSSAFSVSSNISGSTVASTPVTLTLANSGSGSTTISGVIANGSGLASPFSVVVNNTGSGITTFSGANTYSGNTTISSGTLDVANSVALQNSTVNDAGVVMLDSGVATHAFQFGALGGSGNISLTDSGSNAVALTAGGNNANTTYGGVLSGSGSLTKVGTGTMTLSGSNTYTGGTTVSGGTLQLGDGATHNGSVTGGIVNNANVTFANPSAQTFSALISGSGTLGVSGPGTITLNIAETFAGATTVSGGTLQLGDGIANDGSIAGNLVDNATVTFANLNALSYAGTISGSGTLNISGAGGTTLTAANNFAGPVVIGSTLTLANTAGATYSGPISGAGTLTVNSTSVVTLSGANSYSGGTFLTQGTISVASNTALGTGSLTSSGGKLQDSGTTAVTLTNPIIASSGTTTVYATGGAGLLSINGNISGSGVVAINYQGTGTTQINLGGDNSGFTGTMGNYSGNGGIRLKFTNANAGSASANFVTVQTGVDTTGFTFGNGTIQFGSLSGNGYLRQDAAGTTTLAIGGNNSPTEFSGTLAQLGGQTPPAILAITKVGSGTQILSGNNGYTGVTTVSGGTLALAGTVPGSSAYVVGDTPANSSAILDVTGAATQPYPISGTQSLSGFGTVMGNVTIGSSAKLSPGVAGSTMGTLALSSDLTIAPGAAANFTLASSTFSSLVSVGGVLNLPTGTGAGGTGQVTVNITDDANAAGHGSLGAGTYKLFSFATQGTGTTMTTFDPTEFVIGTAPSGFTYAFTEPNTTEIGLTTTAVVSGPQSLTFTGLAGTGAWDINTTTNFTSNGTNAVVYHEGDSVTFNDTNNSQYNITLSAGAGTPTTANSLSPSAVTVNTSSATSSYTFNGFGIAGTTGLTKTGTGTLILNNANTYTGNTNITQGTLTLGATGAIAGSANVNVGVVSPSTVGTLSVLGPTSAIVLTQTLGTLNVNNGAVNLAPVPLTTHAGIHTVLSPAGLSIASTGVVDLTDNVMIVRGNPGTVATNLTNIATYLKAGLNTAGHGYWNGTTGIISSTAATGDSRYLTTIGYRQGDGSTQYENDTAAGANDVIVAYTYYGDADLNGQLNGSDYTQIDHGFSMHLTGWSNGDFNFDGVVDGTDFALIDNTYNQLAAMNKIGVSLALAAPSDLVASPSSLIASPADISAVPEPTTLGLLGIGAMSLLGRGRRRNV